MRFAFVHAEKDFFPIAALCRVLNVTRQGYYVYVASLRSPRLRDEAKLHQEIRAVHAESLETYGSPRVLHALRKKGIRVGKRRVEKALRCMGLRARGRTRSRRTTVANETHTPAGNVLNRDFEATRPNSRWVTDITYIWTSAGWCYLAVILDLFSRSVVGWNLDTNMGTELPMRALKNALQTRRPGPKQLLHHSDRGCQYTSAEYRAALASNGITVSMSRKGNCWDNAVAESFFSTLKKELVHTRTWRSQNELRTAVFDYIEAFYNRQRLHSTLGYRTPNEVESEYALSA